MSSFISKVKKKLKNGIWYPFYNSFYDKVSVDKKEILLLSRNGLALESNILAILTELSSPEYKDFRKVLAVHKNKKDQVQKKLEHYGLSVDKLLLSSHPITTIWQKPDGW